MVDLNITLPEGFLEEEERCGYVILQKMKECWAVQMDLLAELDRVCKNNGLQYFAHAGTLLGAVRHQGFIPWDDDLDVVMLREDYEKLAALPATEFGKGYFLQSTYTDAIVRGHLQLRRDGTTLLTKNDYGVEFHRGIFIDVFVFDNLPISDKELARWKRLVDLSYRIVAFPVIHTWRGIKAAPPLKRIYRTVLKPAIYLLLMLVGGEEKAFARFESFCRKYENTDTPYIGNVEFETPDHSTARDKKENYTDVVMLPFENTTIPCPAGYDDSLRAKYGDYTVFVKGAAYHGTLFSDAHAGYEEYDKLSKKEYLELFNEE